MLLIVKRIWVLMILMSELHMEDQGLYLSLQLYIF